MLLMAENLIENTSKSFEIRSYNAGDENAICALFESVFDRPMGATESIRHWQWEFLENPVKPVAIMLAWQGGKLIGHYVVNSLRAWVQDKEFLIQKKKSMG